MNQSIAKFRSISFNDTDKNSIMRASSNMEDEEIDKKIEKNLQRSRQLQEKIYKEKKEKLSQTQTVDGPNKEKKGNDMSYFLRPV